MKAGEVEISHEEVAAIDEAGAKAKGTEPWAHSLRITLHRLGVRGPAQEPVQAPCIGNWL